MMSHMSHCIKEGYDGYEPFAIPMLNCQNIQASGISGSIWAPVWWRNSALCPWSTPPWAVNHEATPPGQNLHQGHAWCLERRNWRIGTCGATCRTRATKTLVLWPWLINHRSIMEFPGHGEPGIGFIYYIIYNGFNLFWRLNEGSATNGWSCVKFIHQNSGFVRLAHSFRSALLRAIWSTSESPGTQICTNCMHKL